MSVPKVFAKYIFHCKLLSRYSQLVLGAQNLRKKVWKRRRKLKMIVKNKIQCAVLHSSVFLPAADWTRLRGVKLGEKCSRLVTKDALTIATQI